MCPAATHESDWSKSTGLGPTEFAPAASWPPREAAALYQVTSSRPQRLPLLEEQTSGIRDISRRAAASLFLL